MLLEVFFLKLKIAISAKSARVAPLGFQPPHHVELAYFVKQDHLVVQDKLTHVYSEDRWL